MTIRPASIGAAVGLAIAATAAWPMLGAVGELREARARRTELQAELAGPLPTPGLAPERLLAARDPAAARAAAALRIRRTAAAGGVLVESVEGKRQPDDSRVAILRVVASGSEKAVLVLGDTIGRGDPAMRWSRWRLAAMQGGAVRLDGELVVPWR